MKKALLVMSVASMVKQFNIPNIQLLQELGYHVTVATNYENPGNMPVSDSIELMKVLENNNVKTHNIQFGRSPLEKSNIKAYHQLKELISNEKYELIHCQSPIGGVLTRLALKKSQVKNSKLIYTAHGFHFYKGAPLKNWLMFYPVEYFFSKDTDVLITINEEDYIRAQKFNSKNVSYIPGVGIDLSTLKVNKEKLSKIKKELGISTGDIVLSSIGELNNNKNHIVVLKALSRIKDKKIKYIIIGTGPLEKSLKKKVKELNLQKQVIFLGFRDEIYELLSLTDVFVFPSYREGLSKSLMEAMAIGKPIIASDIRGNSDLIDDKKGGFLFYPSSSHQLTKLILEMVYNDSFRKKASIYNEKKIEQFSLENVLNKLSEIYAEVDKK